MGWMLKFSLEVGFLQINVRHNFLVRQTGTLASSQVSDFGKTMERSTLGHWTSLISSTGTFAAGLKEVLTLLSEPACLRCFTTGWVVWPFILLRALAKVVYIVDLPEPGHPKRIALRLVWRVVWSWIICWDKNHVDLVGGPNQNLFGQRSKSTDQKPNTFFLSLSSLPLRVRISRSRTAFFGPAGYAFA